MESRMQQHASTNSALIHTLDPVVGSKIKTIFVLKVVMSRHLNNLKSDIEIVQISLYFIELSTEY